MINKDLSIRKVFGDHWHRETILQVTHIVQEPTKSLLLLDKIKDTKEVIKLMIKMLLSRPKPRYFCSSELRGLPEAYQVTQRVTEQFSQILASYKKEDEKKKLHHDLFAVLD